MPRGFLLLGVFLIGCGSKAPAAKPKEPPTPEPEKHATCDDAAAHVVELAGAEGGVDLAEVTTDCTDRPWPAETIACVSTAESLEGAQGCLVANDPVCQALAQAIELGRDGTYAAARGELIETGEYESTFTLPGASDCVIEPEDEDGYEGAVLTCRLVQTTDAGTAEQGFMSAAGAIDACVGSKGWQRREIQNAVYWEDPDYALPEITVFATSLDYGGTLQHTITVVFEARSKN